MSLHNCCKGVNLGSMFSKLFPSIRAFHPFSLSSFPVSSSKVTEANPSCNLRSSLSFSNFRIYSACCSEAAFSVISVSTSSSSSWALCIAILRAVDSTISVFLSWSVSEPLLSEGLALITAQTSCTLCFSASSNFCFISPLNSFTILSLSAVRSCAPSNWSFNRLISSRAQRASSRAPAWSLTTSHNNTRNCAKLKPSTISLPNSSQLLLVLLFLPSLLESFSSCLSMRSFRLSMSAL